MTTSTAELEDLRRRCNRAIEGLTNNLARLLDNLEARPRYNETSDPLRSLLEILESAAASARSLVNSEDNRNHDITALIGLVEQVGSDVADLARTLPNPASVFGKPVPKAVSSDT